MHVTALGSNAGDRTNDLNSANDLDNFRTIPSALTEHSFRLSGKARIWFQRINPYQGLLCKQDSFFHRSLSLWLASSTQPSKPPSKHSSAVTTGLHACFPVIKKAGLFVSATINMSELRVSVFGKTHASCCKPFEGFEIIIIASTNCIIKYIWQLHIYQMLDRKIFCTYQYFRN